MRGIRIRTRLPARLENVQARIGCYPDNALAVVGNGGDDTRHFGAVPVVPKLCVIAVDEVCRCGNTAAQIGMLEVDTRIDDGNLDALASRPWVRLADMHLLEAALQSDVGIIVACGARRKCLQRLRQLDALIFGQRLEHCVAIRTRGYLQNSAMDVQWFDRPCVDLSQTVLSFHSMHRLAGTRGWTIVRDSIVAARRAAGVRDIGGWSIFHRDYDEAVLGLGYLIAESARVDAHRLAAACAGQYHDNGQHRPSDHGGLPDAGSGNVASAKRTVEC